MHIVRSWSASQKPRAPTSDCQSILSGRRGSLVLIAFRCDRL